MPGGLGPRFALEAGFLILLAAVAAYAQLDATEIILVMAAGWLLASVFEVLAARRERVYTGATWERRVETDEAPADVEDAAEEPEAKRRLSWSRRPEDVTLEPPSPEPLDEPPVSDSPPAPSSRPQVDDESTGEIKLPKWRWFRRGGGRPELSEAEPEARPSARHVRLIRDSPSEEDELEPRHDVEARP
jgi:hypothetical protein